MWSRRSAESLENMSCVVVYKKVKSFKLFEPSVGILGLTVCVIFGFCLLDYRNARKGVSDASQNERFPWFRSDGIRAGFFSEINGACDFFDGDWVWDEGYPLYQSKDCSVLDEGFRCTENGRPDVFYTKWRWQPKNCNLPRFDAKIMLEKMRNKRIVFVGDSIGRNQWESLLCMLSSVVSNKESIFEVNGNPITKHKGFLVFKFSDYNCTVEYYKAPFLVLQSRPPAKVPQEIKTTLKLDRMDWTSPKWKDADVLVFNTGHWWNYEKTVRGGCYFQEGETVKMNMSINEAYQKSLETVVRWIHKTVNATKSQVVFRTYSPIHFRGGDWKSGGTCHSETFPELGSSLLPSHTWAKYDIFSQVISRLTNASSVGAFDVLNITQMTSRRKDAHSSLYYLGPIVGPVALHRQDCSHWCLPGVPDTWNELLYALILKREVARTMNYSSILVQ